MPIDFSSITKGDIVKDAYSQMRISGLTVTPTPSDLELAINNLEIMAAEFDSREMAGGYIFSQYPDPNEAAGIKSAYLKAYSSNLAIRLLADFNKAVPATLFSVAQSSASVLAASTARTGQTAYPSRMPIGSGNTNRVSNWGRFFPAADDIPDNSEIMRVGDADNFALDFTDYVVYPESIVSFEIESSENLTLSDQSTEDRKVLFKVKARKTTDGYSYVKVTITTSGDRVKTRELPFYVGG